MLLDGKQAEMNDVVQRPFLVDMQQDGSLMKPIVHVIDEGTRLRLLANLTKPAGIATFLGHGPTDSSVQRID